MLSVVVGCLVPLPGSYYRSKKWGRSCHWQGLARRVTKREKECNYARKGFAFPASRERSCKKRRSVDIQEKKTPSLTSFHEDKTELRTGLSS